MNLDFHFVLAMDVIVRTAGVGNVLRTSVCTSPIVLEAELLWYGLEFVMMVAHSSKLFKEIKKRYKGLMLNIFYKEKKNRQKSYNLDSYGHSK
jgi:hypothetical protein